MIDPFCASAICIQSLFIGTLSSAVGLSQSSSMAMDSNKAKDSSTSIFDILGRIPTIDSIGFTYYTMQQQAKDSSTSIFHILDRISAIDSISFTYYTMVV